MKTEKELESVVKEDLAHLQNILNKNTFFLHLWSYFLYY